MTIPVMRFMGVLLLLLTLSACAYTGPTARQKWPMVRERASLEMDCENLRHGTLAGGEPRTVADPYPRVYYDYAVRGCGRRGIYRILFYRGGQDEVQLLGAIQGGTAGTEKP